MTDNPIEIYDTMTRSKRRFEPLNPPEVTMYVCGPTVYGDPHIGNIRSFTSGDLLRRWLEYRGYDVKYIMNLTDIDDKTIRDSGKEGKTLKEFTEHYTGVFFRGLDLLNIKRATAHPRATVYVEQMVDFIKTLEEMGYAYDAEDAGKPRLRIRPLVWMPDGWPHAGEVEDRRRRLDVVRRREGERRVGAEDRRRAAHQRRGAARADARRHRQVLRRHHRPLR